MTDPELDPRDPLVQMVREALQVCPSVWQRQFRTAPFPREQWETYIRCIAFALGGYYPLPYDEGMTQWSWLLTEVRDAIRAQAAQYDYHGQDALPSTVTWLRALGARVQEEGAA